MGGGGWLGKRLEQDVEQGKSEKSTTVCFVTKAADIKFHRQTRNPRVLGASEFRLLFASNGERRERAIGPLPLAPRVRMKNRARLSQ